MCAVFRLSPTTLHQDLRAPLWASLGAQILHVDCGGLDGAEDKRHTRTPEVPKDGRRSWDV